MDTGNILIRIIMAIVIGGFIGYEREMRNRPAGFVTHTLVCVGACVVSLIQIQMVQDTILIINENPSMASALKADVGRIVAQVVTGVGFLGAGTIIFDKGSVKGLTTATTLWVVACIGLAIGLGYLKIAIISALGIIFIIVVLKQIEVIAKNRHYIRTIELAYEEKDHRFIEKTVKFLKKHKIQVRDINFIESKSSSIKKCKLVLYSSIHKDNNNIISKLAERDSVVSITPR